MRKCPNWLDSFCAWTLPRSEAPETFIKWTGLYTLASAVRRRVKIPISLMGSYNISPQMYILFIAGPGKARKSTTANYAEDLLDCLRPAITKSPEIVTQATIMQTLVQSPDKSIYVLAPEFGEFIMKSGMDMYGFLTNLFDGKKRIDAGTISRGAELAEKPCINLLGATTPEWLAANMPESIIGGGFASRVIFIFEERVRRRKLYYHDIDTSALGEIREHLIEDLAHISLKIEGDFDIERKVALPFMEKWYDENADIMPANEYKMHGYYERKPAYIHKVAMLLAIAENDELIIKLDHFKRAIVLVEEVEAKLHKTFASVGKNEYAFSMERIHEFINERKKVPQAELLRTFRALAEPSKIIEIANGLVAMEEIKYTTNGKGVIYLSLAQDSSPSIHQEKTSEIDPLEILNRVQAQE